MSGSPFYYKLKEFLTFNFQLSAFNLNHSTGMSLLTFFEPTKA